MEQLIILGVIIFALIMFIWGKWRYDVVSLLAFLFVVFVGVLSPEQSLAGFSHPAVVIVASMFIISKGLTDSGIVELIVRKFTSLESHPVIELFILLIFTAIFSGFLNNVGAIAFMIPVSIKLARKSGVSPSMFLLPIAFASHLGGYMTLIGSPRNIIVSTFRKQATGEPFLMFDFIYVGIGAAVVGVLFLGFIGWRLIPDRKEAEGGSEFEIYNYVTEVSVPEDSSAAGKRVGEVCDSEKSNCEIIALTKEEKRINNPSDYIRIDKGDSMLIKANTDTLKNVVDSNGFRLVGKKAKEKGVSQDPVDEEEIPEELVVMPDSNIVGKTWQEIDWKQRYGVNLFAVSREGKEIKDHLSDVEFQVNDVLLIHGRRESVEETVSKINCMPLKERDIDLGEQSEIILPLAIFIAAVVLASFGLFPLEIIFLTVSLLMVLLGIVSLKEAYESIRWPALILLGSMISIGIAFEKSGGAETVSSFLTGMTGYASPEILVGLVLLISMLLSDFVNATSGAVLMAPVGIMVAQSLGVSVDPFLMAVAVGTSSAFLTPVGHESNLLVLEPGGYKFKDYIKVGLPLELLILASSLPLILYFWPL